MKNKTTLMQPGPALHSATKSALDTALPYLIPPKDLQAPPQRAKMGAVLNNVLREKP